MASETITRSIATLSWIDPVTKLPEVDKLGDPGNSIWRDDITARQGYRFANFLELWVQVWNGAILAHGVTDASRIYRAPSYLKLPSEEFPTLREVDGDRWRVTYTQTVGARTQSPEIIAEQIGFALSLGTVGAPIAREVVEEIVCFPPIWSVLQLTVYADGWFEGKLIRHSLFPSLCYYVQDLDITPTNGPKQRYDPDRMTVRDPETVDFNKGPIEFNQLKNSLLHRVFIDSRPLKGASFSDAQPPGYSKASCYDGVPNKEKWLSAGWGTLRDLTTTGPSGGNPWSIPTPKGRLGAGRPMRVPGMVPTE